jgi:hypothetical protein
MKEIPDISHIAGIIGDPSRGTMLTQLMGGYGLFYDRRSGMTRTHFASALHSTFVFGPLMSMCALLSGSGS